MTCSWKLKRKLLTTKKWFDLKIKISLHNTLNTFKGIIRCQDLGHCTDDEILDNLKSEGVIHVRNIHVRRNGALKRTNTYVLTFNSPVLPRKIKAAFLSVNVEACIPNPVRCYHCQVFVHHEDNCMINQYMYVETSIAVMIATVKKQPNALTAMAHIQFFHATAHHGKKKRRFLKDQLHSSKCEKSLKSNCRLQLTVTPASQKVLVCMLNASTLKHKPMRHTTFN